MLRKLNVFYEEHGIPPDRFSLFLVPSAVRR
jgi:hypothetical protein